MRGQGNGTFLVISKIIKYHFNKDSSFQLVCVLLKKEDPVNGVSEILENLSFVAVEDNVDCPCGVLERIREFIAKDGLLIC